MVAPTDKNPIALWYCHLHNQTVIFRGDLMVKFGIRVNMKSKSVTQQGSRTRTGARLGYSLGIGRVVFSDHHINLDFPFPDTLGTKWSPAVSLDIYELDGQVLALDNYFVSGLERKLLAR